MTTTDAGRGIEMYNYWTAKADRAAKTSRKDGLAIYMAGFLKGMSVARREDAEDLRKFMEISEVEI